MLGVLDMITKIAFQYLILTNKLFFTRKLSVGKILNLNFEVVFCKSIKNMHLTGCCTESFIFHREGGGKGMRYGQNQR